MITEFPEKLTEDLYYQLMSDLGAEPQWGSSNGKRVLLLTGLCHHSKSGHHSVVFDCSNVGEQKVTCFSECSGTFYWWNYIAKALNLTSYEAKQWVIDWLNGKKVDSKVLDTLDFERQPYTEKPFNPVPLEKVPGIAPEIISDLYSHFETSIEILDECRWHTEDKIDSEILSLYDVAIYPDHDTIILPHHNIDGEIVGLYERNFNILRSEAKKKYPDMPYKLLLEYPRAKYVPLVKEGKYKLKPDEKGKTSWSFPNARNLYGLHLAKDRIAETGTAIIFEGAKSVMLARQYGYEMAVASHTFGANENHIAMLIAAGAVNIYLAFDKQYDDNNPNEKEYMLYDKKTKELADRVKDYVNVYRIRDWDGDLKYKDSPIDEGEKIFDKLFDNAEPLCIDCEMVDTKPLDRASLELLKIKEENSEKEREEKKSIQYKSQAEQFMNYLSMEQIQIFKKMLGE